MSSTPLLDVLMRTATTDVEWDGADRPLVIANGKAHSVRDLDEQLACDVAYVVGINQKDFDRLIGLLRAPVVHFFEMRVSDLSGLGAIGDLTALAIRWNTKLLSLDPLEELKSLETLIIEDTPKTADIAALGALKNLRALEYSGGIWNRQTAETLAPIGRLDSLEEIRLTNIRVRQDGLRPLAACQALRHLTISNQFPTADFAYLSVMLPDAACEMFAPYVTLDHPIDDKDTMVVGTRRPFLNAAADAERLERYVAAFRELQRDFRAI